jgi:hypothetical protein
LKITAKFKSRCPVCGGVISVGETIEWTKGKPGQHARCVAEARKAQKAVALPVADDPWTVLHVAPGAPPEVVRAAYLALAKVHHPDLGGDAEKMKQINAAFEKIGQGPGGGP